MQNCPFWAFYLSKQFDKKQVKYIKNSVPSAASSWLQWSLVGFFWEEDTRLMRAGGEFVLVIEFLMGCAGMWQFGAGLFVCFFPVILQTFVQSKTSPSGKPQELKPRATQGILGLTFPTETELGNCPALAQGLFKTCELIWLTFSSVSFHTRLHLNQKQSRGI